MSAFSITEAISRVSAVLRAAILQKRIRLVSVCSLVYFYFVHVPPLHYIMQYNTYNIEVNNWVLP